MKPLSHIILYALCLSLFCSDAASALQQKSRSTRKGAVEEVNPGLPYSVEIDEQSSRNGQIVTLAVNAVTAVKCPSTPLNLGFGNSSGLDYEKFHDRAPGFYLRPRQGGLFTNIVVEFESGPIEFWAKVIEVTGGPKPGFFNVEVIIKPSKQPQSELERTMEQLSASKAEVAKLQERIAELEKRLSEEMAAKYRQSEVEILTLLERATHNFSSLPYTDVPGKKLRVRQLGKAARKEKGWIVVFAIENRGKAQQSITDARIENGQVLRVSTVPRVVPPAADVRLALFIESESAPSQLTLVFSDSTATIRIEI